MSNKELHPVVRKLLFLVFPFLVCLALLILTIYLCAPIKTAGLQKTLSSVLSVKYKNAYTIGAFRPSNTPFDFSSAVFEVSAHRGEKPFTHAALIRMTGISGPITGVFMYAPGLPAEFAGIAGIPNPLDSPFRYGITEPLLQYWGQKMPLLCSREEP